MANSLETKTYYKPVKGGYKRRKVILIDLTFKTVLYLADTEDEPNTAYQTTFRAFKNWMRGCLPEEE